jgi:hypothetical protein
MVVPRYLTFGSWENWEGGAGSTRSTISLAKSTGSRKSMDRVSAMIFQNSEYCRVQRLLIVATYLATCNKTCAFQLFAKSI